MNTFLISSMSTIFGGIFIIKNGLFKQLDQIPSSGIILQNKKLYRTRFSRTELIIDVINTFTWEIEKTWEILGGAHPHDICIHNELLVVVDTFHDRIFWINPKNGQVIKEKQFTEFGDAWHINSLNIINDRLVASIFGRFEENFGWYKKGPEKAGEVIDIESEETLLSGLAAPHAPNIWKNNWLILNSFNSSITIIDKETDIRKNLILGGWPNSMCILEDNTVWVGVSDSMRKPKGPPPDRNTPGRVFHIDLETFSIINYYPMPTSSVYNIIPYIDSKEEVI